MVYKGVFSGGSTDSDVGDNERGGSIIIDADDLQYKIGHIEMSYDITNKEGGGIYENKGVVFEINLVIFKNSEGVFETRFYFQKIAL